MIMRTKLCNGPLCNGKEKPISEFYKYERINKNGKTVCQYQTFCKECHKTEVINNRHKKGIVIPLGKNPNCACFLGVYIAENVLSKVFKNVERMPYGNPGFDFICNKGYKIDVKASTLHYQNANPSWTFMLNRNKIADYFLCLGFDNINDLNPKYIWLLKKDDFYDKASVNITNTKKSLLKWNQYELDDKLEKIISCCKTFKGNIKNE